MSVSRLSQEYEVVIGLEVHVELKTHSKMFCSCPAGFGAEPNTQVCPICLGMPGTLPVINRRAVKYATAVGLALECEFHPHSRFARKNYLYPDLPKGYQVSQYEYPLATGGRLEIETPEGIRLIGIRRVHMEEDAGKSLHEELQDSSLVDYNRAGVPLIEIVSEPDLRSPEEARTYLQTLRNIVRYTGVSDVKMEEGSLRCDANVSLRPRGSSQLGDLTEIKNMNSFRSVKRALEFEVERHLDLLGRGERVIRETRHWDEARGITIPSRSKEEAHDYRYFPEPDLVPLSLEADWVDGIRAELPELPASRRRRLIEAHGLPAYDAGVLTESRELANFFDETIKLGAEPKAASNWIMGDLLGYLNANSLDLDQAPLRPAHLAGMLRLMNEGIISSRIAKEVFELMCRTGKPPEEVVRERGLVQISDADEIAGYVVRVIEENPEAVNSYREGKERAIGFLVGQVMKLSRGKANPQKVNELLQERLGPPGTGG